MGVPSKNSYTTQYNQTRRSFFRMLSTTAIALQQPTEAYGVTSTTKLSPSVMVTDINDGIELSVSIGNNTGTAHIIGLATQSITIEEIDEIMM